MTFPKRGSKPEERHQAVGWLPFVANDGSGTRLRLYDLARELSEFGYRETDYPEDADRRRSKRRSVPLGDKTQHRIRRTRHCLCRLAERG